jgi:hypothetical protein
VQAAQVLESRKDNGRISGTGGGERQPFVQKAPVQGGEADGGVSSIDADVHVRHVHPRVADVPQKEIDRP